MGSRVELFARIRRDARADFLFGEIERELRGVLTHFVLRLLTDRDRFGLCLVFDAAELVCGVASDAIRFALELGFLRRQRGVLGLGLVE